MLPYLGMCYSFLDYYIKMEIDLAVEHCRLAYCQLLEDWATFSAPYQKSFLDYYIKMQLPPKFVMW